MSDDDILFGLRKEWPMIDNDTQKVTKSATFGERNAEIKPRIVDDGHYDTIDAVDALMEEEGVTFDE